MPPRYLAHLEPAFPHWLSLAFELIKRAAVYDRFVVLPTELPIPDLLERLGQARVQDGDLLEEPGPDDQSLRITYDEEGDEHERFLMLASGRFLLEVSLDVEQLPRWLRVAVFRADDDAVCQKFLPWQGNVSAMADYLWGGDVVTCVELE